MAITLRLKSSISIDIRTKVDNLCKEILGINFINYTRARFPTYYEQENNTILFDFQIRGMFIAGEASCNLFLSYVNERLDESNSDSSLLSVLDITYEAADYIFTTTTYIPSSSTNYRALVESNINDIEIPPDYICPISQEIMDHPVCDIRAPQIKYDSANLMYWINNNNPRLMPTTRYEYDKKYMITDYKLQVEISSFIKNLILESTLKKFEGKDNIGTSKLNIEKALRRAAVLGDVSDLKQLLLAGADVNAQDSNPKKGLTAIHWAIKKDKLENICFLINAGARINIPDSEGITALKLIYKLSANERERVLDAARNMGLDIASNVSLLHGFFRTNPDAVSSESSSSSRNNRQR